MTPAILAVLAAALLQTPPDQPPSFWDRPTMLGDLGGVRPALADHGVTFVLAFTGEALANVDGGLDQDTSADLLLDWVIDADLHKAIGWTGGSARVNPLWLAGTGISDEVGDLTRVSNIAGRPGVRVFEAWLQQSLFHNAFSIRAGILAADQEFALTTGGLLYYNSVFGAPSFMSANFPVPVYPVGAPGARARVDLSKSSYAQAAVYDGDPGSERFNRSGLRVRLKDDEGVLTIVEAGFTLGESFPTVLKAGAFHHTADFVEHSSGLLRSGLSGGYVIFEQKLSGDFSPFGGAPGSVDAFVRLGYAQDDRALVSLGLDSGLNFAGLIPGRPADVLGIGFIYARISRAFGRVQPDRPVWGHETVLEVTYKITFTPWLMVQPDVQYIVHPGGSTSIPNAVVLGLRLDVLF